MKKLLSLMLITVLLIPSALSVFATDEDAPEVVVNNEFNYQYVEYVDENNRIVRTYEKKDQPQTKSTYGLRTSNESSDDHERTKALLRDLGMGDAFIDEMSDEDLEDYKNSESIIGVISYVKTDSEGNASYISEDDAMEATASPYVAISPGIFPGTGSDPVYDTKYENSVIRLEYYLTDHGDGVYEHSINAEWLNFPKDCRGVDSIGACSMGLTVENNTRSGWYSFYYGEERQYGEYTSSDFHNAINGDWYGSALKFKLPGLGSVSSGVFPPSKFRLHYEYESKVRYPSLELNFNSNASYVHTTKSLSADPSISIGLEGPSYSIGLSVVNNKQTYIATFPTSFNYTPD